ncbi:type VI secretion system-associated protein TagF [Pararhodobacter sp. SW119]|uniref:type VI secretion system-associated protein TagF n=1 Tax=Pararhodobacter sp. SW119 TaxID=2780075 RepID=UPI001ADF8B46|nr:type VI secretion system-associated protein TagF [Pararhodobacter sp. SW119]
MGGAFGAFGKLPSMGDFLRADTPSGFVEAWDPWLQRSLLAARNALGPRWGDCYMTAPIWRFTLAHGLAGRLPVTGIVMASIDRVGRQFPLTLMAPLPQGTPVMLAHLAGEAIFARLETLALDALESSLDRLRFLQRLASLPRPTPPAAARLAERADMLTLVRAEAGGAADLAGALLENRLRQPSIWSALLAEGTRLMLVDGLPHNGQVTGLFDLTAPVWTQGQGGA